MAGPRPAQNPAHCGTGPWPVSGPQPTANLTLSALGINWTLIRYDDPFGRGFEYVPFSEDDLYGPINELFS